MGKLPNKELKKFLGYIKENPKVVVKPQLGFDSGVHKINDNQYLVISTYPLHSSSRRMVGLATYQLCSF
jgi:hypothetical protein